MNKQINNINPDMLSWAREQAGLTVEEAANSIGLSNSQVSSSAEKLISLEAGEKFPTRNQLIKIASIYRRPLTIFYLLSPPLVTESGVDFRQLPQPLAPREKGLLDALLRDIRARQDMVRSILEDDEDTRPLNFVGSLSVDTPRQVAVNEIRNFLQMGETPPSGISSAEKMFSDLRSRIEAQGVFVLLAGNLGSHHTNISEKIFRGFAIADKIAPFIVINDQDAKTARCFTLVHELVHLFVGTTGISGAITGKTPRTQIERTERFCNDVASEFLLPTQSIEHFSQMQTFDEANEIIPGIASKYNISEHLVAYRFLRGNQITNEIYQQLASHYAMRWKEARERKRAENQEGESNGPSYYTIKRYLIGNALLELVGRTMRGGELTHTKAAKLLGTKISSVDPMLSKVKVVSGTFLPDHGV